MLTFAQFLKESNAEIEPTGQNSAEWGWLDQRGNAVVGVKPKNKKKFGHYDMTTTRKYGLPAWHSIFYDGFVRYSIGINGDALFNYHPSGEAKRNIIAFMVKNHGRITGSVWLDPSGPQSGLRKELTKFSSPHAAMLELDD